MRKRSKPWRVIRTWVRGVHVYPIADLKKHVLKGTRCWCKPTFKLEGKSKIFTHNSADGRELIERHGIN